MFKPTTGNYYRNKSKSDTEWFLDPKNKDHPLVIERNRVIHNKWISDFNREDYLKTQPYQKLISDVDKKNKFISEKLDIFVKRFYNILYDFVSKQQCGCSKGYFNGSDLDYLINYMFLFNSSLENYVDLNTIKDLRVLNLEKGYWNFSHLNTIFISVDPAFQYNGKLDRIIHKFGIYKEIEFIANILNIPKEIFELKIFSNGVTLKFKFQFSNNLIKYMLRNINLNLIKYHFITYNEFNLENYKLEYLNNNKFFYEDGKKIFRGNRIGRKHADSFIYTPEKYFMYDSRYDEFSENITREIVELPQRY